MSRGRRAVKAEAPQRIEAVCETACFWQLQYWHVGRTYSGTRVPPSHFRILKSTPEPEIKKPEPETNPALDKLAALAEANNDDDFGSDESDSETAEDPDDSDDE